MELPVNADAYTQPGLVLTPAWYGLKQQIRHLAQFGGSVQVVCGASGAGKTTLLNLLADEDDLALVCVDAQQHPNLAELLAIILRELGLVSDSEPSAGEAIAHLRGYVQQLEKAETRTVIALDNADCLDDAALAALVSVLQGHQDVGFGLHWLFLSKPGLAERIDQLQLLDVSVSDAAIPNFSPSELKTLLAQAYKSKLLTSQVAVEQVQRIWVQSGGLPGVALQLAEQVTQAKSAAGSGWRGAWPISHIAALILLLGVLAWAVLVRDPQPSTSNNAPAVSDEADRTQTTIAIPESKQTMPAAAEQEAQAPIQSRLPTEEAVLDSVHNPAGSDIPEPKPRVTSPEPDEIEQEAEPGLNLDVKNTSVVEETANTNAEAQTAIVADEESPDVSVMEEVSGDVKSKSNLQSELKPTTAPQLTQSSVDELPSKQEDERPSSNAERVLVDEQQLLNLPADSYVLQLMATSALETLFTFVDGQPNQDNLMVYRATRNGKRLYILLEGFYNDARAAQAGIAKLPEKQQKGGPWPKKVESIQREIRQNSSD